MKLTEVSGWILHYRNIWGKFGSQLFEKLTTEPIKEKGNISMVNCKHGKNALKLIFTIIKFYLIHISKLLNVDFAYKYDKKSC